MAKLDSSTLQNNSAHESSAPDVPQNAEGISRRSLMNMMTAVAAVPTVALATPVIADPTADRTEWESAYANYRVVEARHNALGDAWEAAQEAADNATPDRVDRYFDEFNLGIGMSRRRVMPAITHAIVRRDYPEGHLLFREESAAVVDDAERLTDEFMGYQQKITDARERYQTEQRWDEMRAHQPKFEAARNAFMAVPAPDTDALLTKMEIAAVSLDDDHADSCLADAKRLLGKKIN